VRLRPGFQEAEAVRTSSCAVRSYELRAEPRGSPRR
jgi:hypothetical protein